MLRQIIEELIGALDAGSLDARNRHLSRTWLLLDERGWKELMRATQAALDRIQAIQERCAKRREGLVGAGDPGLGRAGGLRDGREHLPAMRPATAEAL